MVRGERVGGPAAGRGVQAHHDAAVLAGGDARSGGRHPAHHPHVPGAALWNAPHRVDLDVEPADPRHRLVLCRAEPGHALLGAARARLRGRPWWRQLLLVHALDQPVLSQAPARHGAGDPGGNREFRRQRGAVPDALADRVRRVRNGRGRAADFHQGRRVLPDLATERHGDLRSLHRRVRGACVAVPAQRAGARELPRAARHFQQEARVLHDAALHHDFRIVLGLLGHFSPADPSGLRRAARRPRSAGLCVPRAARRFDLAHHRRADLRPARRGTGHAFRRLGHVCLHDRRDVFYRADIDGGFSLFRRLHARCIHVCRHRQCIDVQADADAVPAAPSRRRDRLDRRDGRLRTLRLRHHARLFVRLFRFAQRLLLLGGVFLRDLRRRQLVVLRPQGRGSPVLNDAVPAIPTVASGAMP